MSTLIRLYPIEGCKNIFIEIAEHQDPLGLMFILVTILCSISDSLLRLKILKVMIQKL